jgi:hypothetical protein
MTVWYYTIQSGASDFALMNFERWDKSKNTNHSW